MRLKVGNTFYNNLGGTEKFFVLIVMKEKEIPKNNCENEARVKLKPP